MISQTALERMPTLETKANEILKEMQSFNATDISNLQDLLKIFFANVTHYMAVRSSLSNKISTTSYNELLSTIIQYLRNTQNKEKQQAKKISMHILKLKEIDRKEVELRKWFEFLDIHRKKTLSLLRK